MEFYTDGETERAGIYKLFSALFMEQPDDQLIFQVKEMFQMKFDDTPQEIRADYDALFLKSDFHLSPHESLHNYPLGETPGLWGRAAHEVLAFYRSEGLVIDEDSEVIPDHLGLELLFMSYLIEHDRVEQQRKFIDEHLLPWAAEYCDEIERHATTTFYKEVAILLKEFVVSDSEELGGGHEA